MARKWCVLGAVLISLCATASGEPWTVPDAKGVLLMAALTTSDREYEIFMCEELDVAAANGPSRIEPVLSSYEQKRIVLCRKWIDGGKLEKAEKSLDACLRRSAANHEARALRARCHLARGDKTKALAEIRASLIGNRRNPEGWKTLEKVAEALGKKVARPEIQINAWILPEKNGSVHVSYANSTKGRDNAWLYYSVARAHYRYEGPYATAFPRAKKEYRFTFREQLYALGATIEYASGVRAKKMKVADNLMKLLAEVKAGTIVPFAWFAIYTEPTPKKPEAGYDELRPILEKYFDEHILVSR